VNCEFDPLRFADLGRFPHFAPRTPHLARCSETKWSQTTNADAARPNQCVPRHASVITCTSRRRFGATARISRWNCPREISRSLAARSPRTDSPPVTFSPKAIFPHSTIPEPKGSIAVSGATGEARPSGPAHEAGGSPVSLPCPALIEDVAPGRSPPAQLLVEALKGPNVIA
jgi:hypothetical protein